MPWKETHVEEERRQFIAAYTSRDAGWQMSQMCLAFGISRKTGYKWLDRFNEGGQAALSNQSRARHTQEHATAEELSEALLEMRRAHPSWGPRKLLHVLGGREPQAEWPAASTVGEILRRHNLVEGRRRRPKATPTLRADLRDAKGPNEAWGADFKGWFLTGDGKRCDPLTITDLGSRFLLKCQRVRKTNGKEVRKEFQSVFRENGLPQAIRTDNGAPFASVGLGGLSRLSVWWVKLGIELERITPGRPEQNGRHERMHRTLKQETTRPPAFNASAQQRLFNRFRHVFNWERPHEAIDNECPGQRYKPSRREYPSREPEMEYGGNLEVRRVRTSGEIKWRGELIYLSEALIGEPVSLQEVSDRHWLVCFGPVQLAFLDNESGKLLPIRAKARSRESGDAPDEVKDSGRPSGSLRPPPRRKGTGRE